MKILQILFIGIFFLFVFVSPSFAAPDPPCIPDDPRVECKFGTITPPPPLASFIGTDPTGATGISKFLSNLVILIYSLSTVMLIFMLLWGAFEWITSGGDKEAIAKARGRIMNALIGMLLLAVAFGIIQVLGTFTGFKFFVGQS